MTQRHIYMRSRRHPIRTMLGGVMAAFCAGLLVSLVITVVREGLDLPFTLCIVFGTVMLDHAIAILTASVEVGSEGIVWRRAFRKQKVKRWKGVTKLAALHDPVFGGPSVVLYGPKRWNTFNPPIDLLAERERLARTIVEAAMRGNPRISVLEPTESVLGRPPYGLISDETANT